jgi:hypothetical protein
MYPNVSMNLSNFMFCSLGYILPVFMKRFTTADLLKIEPALPATHFPHVVARHQPFCLMLDAPHLQASRKKSYRPSWASMRFIFALFYYINLVGYII